MSDQVAGLVHIELALEHFGVGVVADRDEHAFDGQRLFLLGLDVAQRHHFDVFLVHIVDFFDRIRRHECDFLVGAGAIEHDFGSAKFVAAVDERDMLRKLRQKRGFFHCRVAAADDEDVAVAKEKTVAGGAGGNAVAQQVTLRFNPEHARRRAGRDDQRLALVRLLCPR